MVSAPAPARVGLIPAAVKASPLALSADLSSEAAFVAIVAACLRHAEANEPAVLSDQVEGIHQMRVAFRRLRSALKLFRTLVPRAASATLVEEIRWLNSHLGPARDWDVFAEEGLTPLLAHFPRKRGLLLFRQRVAAIRAAHHRALREALAEPRYALLRQSGADWLARQPWREGLRESWQRRLAAPLPAFATPLLERQYRRVVKQGEHFAQLSAERRHRLRIRVKELRYALDFLAGLYPAAEVRDCLGALSRLQDDLGVMNDIAVTRRLLDEAGLRTVTAARQVIEGWYGCRLDVHERGFVASWLAFMDCKRPWKD
ncbi:MAG TPA: CHAD domain-containing protein [Candidatus Competibacteraceae bacterium]|nr:MAG: CHAD domain-containing protein [Candidatus Competibacteraceae bacterium]HQC73683.1 CHAD domain-containing protein [Candidatus Competibacteraceae bacterium]